MSWRRVLPLLGEKSWFASETFMRMQSPENKPCIYTYYFYIQLVPEEVLVEKTFWAGRGQKPPLTLCSNSIQWYSHHWRQSFRSPLTSGSVAAAVRDNLVFFANNILGSGASGAWERGSIICQCCQLRKSWLEVWMMMKMWFVQLKSRCHILIRPFQKKMYTDGKIWYQ